MLCVPWVLLTRGWYGIRFSKMLWNRFSLCSFLYILQNTCSTVLKYGYRNPIDFKRWVKVAKSDDLCYICVMGMWKSKNRHKYLLQYHIIFVCKYRKKLLASKQISDDIKQFSYEICQKHKVIIRYMETDKDHIHYMIETEPTMSISKIVNLVKSYNISYLGKISELFTSENISGKNIPFGRMDILPAV